MALGITMGFATVISEFLSLQVSGRPEATCTNLHQNLHLAGHILSTSSLIHVFLEDIHTLWCFPRMF